MEKFCCLLLVFGVFVSGDRVRLPTSTRDSVCLERNARYPQENYCDSYIECTDYNAKEVRCPDGLHFNRETPINEYPCVFPTEAPCMEHALLHPAEPTKYCPRQYGLFVSPNSTDCSGYVYCVAGVASFETCPDGLAFNPDHMSCDWPENVKSCEGRHVLSGIKCPTELVDADGNDLNVDIINLPIEGNCKSFYSCVNGNPRLLSCDAGYAFDHYARRCLEEELVSGCGN